MYALSLPCSSSHMSVRCVVGSESKSNSFCVSLRASLSVERSALNVKLGLSLDSVKAESRQRARVYYVTRIRLNFEHQAW